MQTNNQLPELLPSLRGLSRADKLLAIQFLAAELASEEGGPLIEAHGEYPVWTPFHASDAAAVLLNLLEAEGRSP